MCPGNNPGDNAHPRTEQNTARHHCDNTHVDQRAFNVHAGPGAEQGKQREDGSDGQKFFWRVCGFMQKFAKEPDADQEEQTNQH
ncbi:hypothetical protein D3C76_1090120 [compost metagenome]